MSDAYNYLKYNQNLIGSPSETAAETWLDYGCKSSNSLANRPIPLPYGKAGNCRRQPPFPPDVLFYQVKQIIA